MSIASVLARHHITQTWEEHLDHAGPTLGGVDWAMPVGTLLPPPPATVAQEWVTPTTRPRPAWYNTGLGNAVAWVHADGTRTIYAHGSALDDAGFHSGNSGNSTGPHVHIHDVLPDGHTRAKPFSTITTPAADDVTPFDTKEIPMPALIRTPDGSIGLVTDAGELQPISSMTEVQSLQAAGIVPDKYVQLPDRLVWNTLAARTERNRTALATEIAKQLKA